MQSQYKEGKVVTIYTDPLTCRRPEGRARLVFLRHLQDNAEYWDVIFAREDRAVGRWIRREQHETAE